ncbi:hypothetical protein R6Q59_032786 [Mikania micrantha]
MKAAVSNNPRLYLLQLTIVSVRLFLVWQAFDAVNPQPSLRYFYNDDSSVTFNTIERISDLVPSLQYHGVCVIKFNTKEPRLKIYKYLQGSSVSSLRAKQDCPNKVRHGPFGTCVQETICKGKLKKCLSIDPWN